MARAAASQDREGEGKIPEGLGGETPAAGDFVPKKSALGRWMKSDGCRRSGRRGRSRPRRVPSAGQFRGPGPGCGLGHGSAPREQALGLFQQWAESTVKKENQFHLF